jgi:hypothetical protein
MVMAVIGLAVVNSVLLIRSGLARIRDQGAPISILGWVAIVAGAAALVALAFAFWRLNFSGQHLS